MTAKVPPKSSGGLTRSQVMARVKSTDTAPEMTVRRALHAAGLRYRLHLKNLPGRPDVVLSSRRVALFVHGCFWHSHAGCRRARMPSTRQDYWGPKLARNQERDFTNEHALRNAGWNVLVVWECQTKDAEIMHRTVQSIFELPIQNALRSRKHRCGSSR